MRTSSTICSCGGLFAFAAALFFAPRGFGQADGAQRWAFTSLSSSTPGSIISSPAVAAEGTVYFGVEVGTSTSPSPAGRLFAVTPAGTEKWEFTTPDWIDSAPAIASDGTIYFGCWDGTFYALNPDGTKKWTYVEGSFITSTAAIGGDGTVFFGAGSGNLCALNPNGTLKWTFPTSDWVTSSPAVGPDGTIYFGSQDNNFYAVRPDGTEKWHYATGGDIASSPAIAADGTIYVGSRDLTLYAFSPAGDVKWSLGLGDTIEASPAIGPDGTIYITTTGGRLYAINPDSSERWRYPKTGQSALLPLYSSPAVRSDGSVVFGTSNGSIVAVKSDGTLLWQSMLADYADSSPVVSGDGSIYIGCYDKKLYAFASSAGPAMADWPQFHHDSQRTGVQSLGNVSGTTGRLLNLSVRTMAATGAGTLIVGFVTTGAGTRSLLVRGVGPTLASYGVSGSLANPQLTAFAGGTTLAYNDDWGMASNAAQISATAATVGAFPLPAGSSDSALLRDFSSGTYSAHISGVGGATGIALMEAYDAGGAPSARLVNVSARTAVGTGAGILIAGFVVTENNRAVLVRAIGPTLAGYGVPDALADPVLRVFRGAQLIAENDDWTASSNTATIAAKADAIGAFALAPGTKDAVLLLVLPPGVYSAQVSGVGNTTGVALVEIYEVP